MLSSQRNVDADSEGYWREQGLFRSERIALATATHASRGAAARTYTGHASSCGEREAGDIRLENRARIEAHRSFTSYSKKLTKDKQSLYDAIAANSVFRATPKEFDQVLLDLIVTKKAEVNEQRRLRPQLEEELQYLRRVVRAGIKEDACIGCAHGGAQLETLLLATLHTLAAVLEHFRRSSSSRQDARHSCLHEIRKAIGPAKAIRPQLSEIHSSCGRVKFQSPRSANTDNIVDQNAPMRAPEQAHDTLGESLVTWISAKRDEIKKHKEILPQRREDERFLRHLLVLGAGENNDRCHQCDIGLANMKIVLAAMLQVVRAVYDRLDSAEDGETVRTQILHELAQALARAMHVDLRLQELHAHVEKVLPSV